MITPHFTLAPALDAPDFLAACADLTHTLGPADTLQLYPPWLLDSHRFDRLLLTGALTGRVVEIEAGVIKANPGGDNWQASADWLYQVDQANEPNRIADATTAAGSSGFILAMDEPISGTQNPAIPIPTIAPYIARYKARIESRGGSCVLIEAYPHQSKDRILALLDLVPMSLRLDVDHVGVKLTAAHWADIQAMWVYCTQHGLNFELIISDPSVVETSAAAHNAAARGFIDQVHAHAILPTRFIIQSWNPNNIPTILPPTDPNSLTGLLQYVAALYPSPGELAMPSTRSTPVTLIPAGNGQAGQRVDGLFVSVDSTGNLNWKPTVGGDETFIVNDAKTAFIFHNTFVGVQDFVRPVTKVGDLYYVLED